MSGQNIIPGARAIHGVGLFFGKNEGRGACGAGLHLAVLEVQLTASAKPRVSFLETCMKNLLNRFVREDTGQDLIEYALLAGLISLASVVAITALGAALEAKFTEVGTVVAAS